MNNATTAFMRLDRRAPRIQLRLRELNVPIRSEFDGESQTLSQMVLENLRTAGVQQAHKEDRIVFTMLAPWSGLYISAEGRCREGNTESGAEKRAAIFIGPEFGTVSRPDLVAAAAKQETPASTF